MRFIEFKMEIDQGLKKGPPYPREQRDAVKAMQQKLEALGYSVGSTGIDGMYGPRTAKAVAAFKKDNQIVGDGNSVNTKDIAKLQTAKKVSNPTKSNLGKTASGDDDFVSPGYPADLTQKEIEQIIKKESMLRGIDPRVAIAIFRSEGAGSYQSNINRSGKGSLGGKEASFGPYQLYTGGGLGNIYQKKTGRDLTQDNTEEGITNQIRFALDAAVKQSWQPWYGRKLAGVGRYDGLRGAKQIRNWA